MKLAFRQYFTDSDFGNDILLSGMTKVNQYLF